MTHAGSPALPRHHTLTQARIRFAGVTQVQFIRGDLELLTLAGSVTADSAHLHASVATAQGEVLGGHVPPGCIVRTTAAILLTLLPDWNLSCRPDPAPGFAELLVSRKALRTAPYG
jgi:hypothetical protein